MKKTHIYIAAFMAFLGVIYAAPSDATTAKNLLESKTKRSLEVISFTPLESSSLFLLTIQDKTNGYKTLLISDEKQQNLVVASAFFSSNEVAMKRVQQELNAISSHNFKAQNSAKLNELFASIPTDYAITITGANTKKLYIISDPMCSHCQEELAHIEERLKTHTIVIIPIGLLGQDSLYKAADIIRQIPSAKTPKDQIQTLRKIYARTYEPTNPPANDKAYSQVLRITNSIRESGLVEGVPFIYEPLR